MNGFTLLVVLLVSSFAPQLSVAQTCGSQVKGALCPGTDCCSQFGFCGSTADFCLTSKRCQSRCINDGPPPPPAGPPAPTIDPTSLFVPPANTFSNKQLVGYFSNWAQYRGLDPSTPGCDKSQQFLPENINPHLYTHINYAFVFMAQNNSVIPHEYDDEDLSTRLNNWVKSVNPSCKTSFSVGGWSMNDGPSRFTGGIDYTPFFSQMASSSASRATFIQSCIDWARKLGFDGIDIDWEFIGDTTRGGTANDKPNFTSLMSEMRAAVNAEAASSGKPPLLITVAAPASPTNFAAFDAPAVSQFIDWFNLMTYDFYGNWENQIDTHAPIEDTFTPTWSFHSAINLYVNAGVPSGKIMAGLPLYGRVWTLADTTKTVPGSSGTAGVAGRCTAQNGYLAYFEIEEIIKAQGTAPGITFAPNDGYYLTFDNQWVGYDDQFSFSAKMKIIDEMNLGGAMLWAIDLDTANQTLTRTLLNFYQTCPQNGDWPATAVGTTQVLPCPPPKDDNTQNRVCNSDGTWGAVDNQACQTIALDNLAAQICVQGQ